MTTPSQICAAQRAYEYRMDQELKRLTLADDETNYCSGDCETCDIPYCCIEFRTNNNQEEDDENDD